jgi:hypothetical protein
MAGQIWPPDGIYAAIDGVQPASVDAVLNRLGAQA